MNLTTAFLKIFFRNKRAIFFVILLPVGIFLASAFLGLEGIVRFNKPLSYEDFLLTGVIAFAMMQTGIYTVTYTFIDYQRGQVFKRLSVTPLPAGKFLFSQILARLLIAFIQAGVLLAIAIIQFGTKISPTLFLLPLMILVGSTIFLNLGFLLSSFTKDYEQAAPYTTVIGTGLMFLGDAFFPIENLPPALAKAAEYLPLEPLAGLMRYSILGLDSGKIAQQSVVLLAWLAASYLLATAAFSKKAYK